MSDRPHNPCGTCGICCRSYIVPLCGYDVWRISTLQRLGPEQFVIACEQGQPGADGFLLDDGQSHYGLVLDKRGPVNPKRPCVFLIDLAGGHSRCGIYEHRPVVCQAYPMVLSQTGVAQRRDSLCPPNSWPPAAIARPHWHLALQRQRMHIDIYHLVVACWNQRVVSRGSGTTHSLGEFFDYLMNVYDRLETLAIETGAQALGEIERTWGQSAAAPHDSATADAPPEAPIWYEYCGRAGTIIDEFYGSREPVATRTS